MAKEPEPVTAYRDRAGNLHASLTEAMASNFTRDINEAVVRLDPERHGRIEMNAWSIKKFIRDNPDIVRAILAGRDRV